MLVQRITIAPSVRLALGLCVAHLAAAGLLWLTPIPELGKAIFTLAIAVSLVFFLGRDAALHAGNAIIALELKEGGRISFHTRGGDQVDCELADSSYVSPALTIVNLRRRGRRRVRHVILLSDNIDPGDYRRLRMWMRWKDGTESDPARQPEC